MRKIVLIKGPPSSGKSSLAVQLGWEAYVLEKDQIRLLRRAPELSPSGVLQINQEENEKVQKEWMHLMHKRMGRGEFLVLTSIFDDVPSDILAMAKRYRYECAVIDLSKKPLDLILEQNSRRPEYRKVSSDLIKKIHNKMSHNKPWEGVENFVFDANGDYIEQVKKWSQVSISDLNQYKKIIHIGDLQGCLSVLLSADGPLENQTFNDDYFYVFVGDLLDRGVENGELLKWFIKEALPRENVALVWGNHENHIDLWAQGLPAVSEEFEQKTLPQLIASGVTPEDAEKVCQKAVENLFYTFNDQKVMVTHAGLPTVPQNPELISLRQYSKGTGNWSDPIDEQFERHAPKEWVQVHGHRNHGWQEIQATPRSFSLEDQVEFGGRLRWCALDNEGWTVGSVRNTIYDAKTSSKIEKKKTNWKSQGNKISDQSFLVMREHVGVKEKQQSQSHIVSFNFTKDVFFKAAWDDVVVKARGFFINKNTKEVVARGYDKFFNINERPETDINHLAKNMTFPVIGYVKENGYLGNLGYDAETGDLFVATKSSSEGEFSQWFRQILDRDLSPTKQEGLARFLRDNEACLTFEVIDPQNDPHMIEYEQPKIVLLDMFHRHEDTERLSYEELKVVGHKFGFEVKERGVLLPNPLALVKWHEKIATDLTFRHRKRDIEGYVLEDQQGNMTKIKLAHYSFWKRMRGQKDRMKNMWTDTVVNARQKSEHMERKWQQIKDLVPNPETHPLAVAPRFSEEQARTDFIKYWQNKQEEHPAAQAFLSWCASLSEQEWEKSIIELRKEFLQSNYPQHVWTVPFDQYPKDPSVDKINGEGCPASSNTKRKNNV